MKELSNNKTREYLYEIEVADKLEYVDCQLLLNINQQIKYKDSAFAKVSKSTLQNENIVSNP